MSNNFWEEQLSDDGSKDEADKSSRKRIESSERNVKIDVNLDDFPVNNWDSDNDGQETIEIHPGASIIGLFGGWTFAGLWCTVSFVALFFIGGPVLTDIGTSDWNATDGVILESGVDSSSDGEGGTTYCLWVDYQYTYDNETFDGNIVSFSKQNTCNSWSEDADEDYPAGKEITVYVNPDNPYDAVLETGFSGVDFAVCCILPFPLIGIVLIIGMLKNTVGTVSSLFNK